jgi:hypothetical protein
LISVRICTRSFASRFDNGSSNRKHARVADDRAAHRHALPLAARELARIALEIRSEAEDVGRLFHACLDLALRLLCDHQRERHVVANGHVRIERVVLEHHRDVALLRRLAIDHGVADRHFAAGDLLEAGDHPQERRLAASRRSDQHAELAVADLDIDAADHMRRPEPLVHGAKRYPQPCVQFDHGLRLPATTTYSGRPVRR